MATLEAITLTDPARFCQNLKEIEGIRGAVILQTCNRVEMFLEVDVRAEVVDKVLWQWAFETGFELEQLTRLVEKKQGRSIIEHLVRLGAGLESMLVGESQILGQVRTALLEARTCGTATPFLVELFDRTTSAASKIRDTSGIGKGAVSLGSAALRLAEETLGPLEQKKVLLIGTGQVALLLMTSLKARHVGNVTVIGRTLNQAQVFSRSYGGCPADFQQLHAVLASSDIVFVATSATGPLITKEIVQSARGNDGGSKLMVFNLSKPRNVSPDVQEANRLLVRTIDDLRSIGDESLAMRREIVKQTEQLVQERVESIVALFQRQRAEPIISDTYRRVA